jgi:hypothetical protein
MDLCITLKLKKNKEEEEEESLSGILQKLTDWHQTPCELTSGLVILTRPKRVRQSSKSYIKQPRLAPLNKRIDPTQHSWAVVCFLRIIVYLVINISG